jgi:hypothetical protein
MQPAFRPSVTSVPIGVFGSGLIFVSLCPRGPGRTEEPFLEGDPAHNARAVFGLDAATAAALPAPKLTRQDFRIGEADMAALLAGDFDHHGVCSASIPSGTKKPPAIPGAKFTTTAWGKTGKSNPRRAVILARRGHGRDGEGATEATPSISAHGLVSTFGTNNWPARTIISCRSFDARCWQMRTFQLGRFGSE